MARLTDLARRRIVGAERQIMRAGREDWSRARPSTTATCRLLSHTAARMMRNRPGSPAVSPANRSHSRFGGSLYRSSSSRSSSPRAARLRSNMASSDARP